MSYSSSDHLISFLWTSSSDLDKSCRNNTEDPTGAVDYPSQAMVFLQWIASKAAAILNSSLLFKTLPGRTQGSINGKSSLLLCYLKEISGNLLIAIDPHSYKRDGIITANA